jgi:hypothetical protein
LLLTVKKLGRDICKFRQEEGSVVPAKFWNTTENPSRPERRKK